MENRSNEQTAPKPEHKQIVKARKAKTTIPDKLHSTFVKKDLGDVASYLISDVAVPALKDTIVDLGKNALDMIFYGENRGKTPSGLRRTGGQTKVDYGGYSRSSRSYDRPPWEEPNRRYGHYRFQNVTVEERSDAENVLRVLWDDCRTYGMVAVSELYQLTGLSTDIMDQDYGWSDLSDARIQRVRDGWKIIMPPPEYIGEER